MRVKKFAWGLCPLRMKFVMEKITIAMEKLMNYLILTVMVTLLAIMIVMIGE